MARKSRIDMRREAEAAEAQEKAAPKSRKKATKKTTRKKATTKRKTTKKTKAPPRERLVWAVFSGNMKEEARFPYDQRAEADAKVEQLRSKATKKLYFVQPVKEAIEGPPPGKNADAEEEE